MPAFFPSLRASPEFPSLAFWAFSSSRTSGGAAATGGLGYRAAHGVLLQALDEMLADAEAVLGPPEPNQ